MTEAERQILAKAYINAGREFVANRLSLVFGKIENQDSVAIHNFTANELSHVVGSDKENVIGLFKAMADLIMDYAKKGLQ
jgi:hypothetical protein